MIRPVLVAVLISAGGPVMALSQLELSVQTVLKEYGFENVDVTELNSAQLATIKHIGGQSSKGQKRGEIRSVLGRDTLRTLFTRR